MVEKNTKIILGMAEFVTLKGKDRRIKKTLPARIDTGATRSSIDAKIVNELKLGPVVSVLEVKNANGVSLRPTIEVEFKLRDKNMKAEFTVSDRSHMKYKALIGRNVLKKGFLVDPSINETKKKDKKKWLKQD